LLISRFSERHPETFFFHDGPPEGPGIGGVQQIGYNSASKSAALGQTGKINRKYPLVPAEDDQDLLGEGARGEKLFFA